MDSISQLVLGAAVGEAVCGKRAGNKAVIWGAVAGTIPDLDILASPFLDFVGQITFHRSITHSIVFAVIIAPILGYLFKKYYKNDETTFLDWTNLFFWGFITHVILDCFTTWGTQVFWPFSDYRVSFHNIFVIDPLYTIPLLVCVTAVLFYDRKDVRRRYWNWAGLGLSSFYILVTIINKLNANQVFEKNFKTQNIPVIDYSSRPTPFNSILWAVTAEVSEGYYIGYYSLLDDDQIVNFDYFPKDHYLLKPFSNNKELQTLLHVTDGYYTVDQKGDSLLIHDLRFGQLDGWSEGHEDFTFTYIAIPENGSLKFSQKENNLKKARELMEDLFKRVLGNEP